MEDRDIDAVILSLVSERWQKVAMIAVKTLSQLGIESRSNRLFAPLGLSDPDHALDAVLRRIEALVHAKALEAVGNLSLPRHSEIRAAQRAPAQ